MLKIGVFGAWRGNAYIDLFKEDEEIEIIAICDKNIDKLIENKDEFNFVRHQIKTYLAEKEQVEKEYQELKQKERELLLYIEELKPKGN